MTDDVAALALLAFICGILWGQWLAERKATKVKRDDGVILLARMANQLLESRKFTGDSVQMTASHELQVNDNHFTLSLTLNGVTP